LGLIVKYWKCDNCNMVYPVETLVSLEGFHGRDKHFCDVECFWLWCVENLPQKYKDKIRAGDSE